jgi:hypothetical protein
MMIELFTAAIMAYSPIVGTSYHYPLIQYESRANCVTGTLMWAKRHFDDHTVIRWLECQSTGRKPPKTTYDTTGDR